MIGFISRRLLGAVPTLLLLVTLTFFLLRLAPGGPFDSDRAFPPEVMANILRKYGLDQPLPVQFGVWLRDLFRGDLGESFQFIGKPVAELILEALPVSILLGGFSLLFALVLGIPAGCIAAWKRGRWPDHVLMFGSVAGMSLPSYLVASILVLLFSLRYRWLPPALWEDWTSLVLPVITLGLRPLALVARLTRASMIESMASDYIRTALGKGLAPRIVVFKHALRNSLIPVITLIGPIAASLLTGSFLVETVFQLPGVGKYFVTAVINRDYPLVMGVTLLFGVVLILCNLAVDLLYGFIDPRLREQA